MVPDYHYIYREIGYDEILCQLEEEAAELIQAASKLRRARMGVNPTPVSESKARVMLREELADVCLCAKLLGYDPESTISREIQERKVLRWISRVNSKEV